MPKVPTLQQNTVPEAKLQGTSFNLRASAQQLGANSTAQVMGEVSQGVKTFMRIKERNDKLAAQDAETKALEKKQEILSKATSLKGKDAVGAYELAKTEWDKFTQEQAKQLSNDTQRDLFRRSNERIFLGLDKQVQVHTVRENEAYDEMSTQANIEAARMEAFGSYGDTPTVLGAIASQEKAIRDRGAARGLPDEYIKNQVLEAKSKTHAGVISQFANNESYEKAKGHLELFKDEMTPEEYARARSIVEAAEVDQFSQRQSDAILARHASMTDALKEARKIKDPKKRDQTVRRVKMQFADNERAERMDRENLFEGVYNRLVATGGQDEIPQEDLLAMSPNQQEKVMRFREKLRSGKAIETDMDRYYELELMASNPKTRDDFLKLNLKEEFDSLSQSDRKRFIKLQSSMRQRGAGSPEFKRLLSKTKTLNNEMRRADIDPKSEEGIAFQTQMDERLQEFQIKEGREATNEDIRKLAEALTTEVIVEKRTLLWDKTKRVFEMEQGEQILGIEDIPDEDVALIKEALEKRGIVANDVTIQRYYLKRRLGM